MPAKREKMILITTCISAAVNVGLNFCLIPIWKENATAFTTVVAEFIMSLVCVMCGMKITKIKLLNKNTLGVLVGCAEIVCVCRIVVSCNYSPVIQLIGTVAISGIVYVLTLVLFHNDTVCTTLRKVCRTHEE